jgi:hypothetical protein
MRPLLLIFLTFAVMIGLPRLADRFRGGQPRGGTQVASVANAQTEMPEAAVPHASSAPQPVSLLPTPLQASPVNLTAHAPSNAGSFTEGELTFAIEKELIRVGYYDGPATGRWTRRVRLAARRFIHRTGGSAHYSSPSANLLDSLKRTASAGRTETSGAGFAMLAQRQLSMENLRSPESPAQDYLPVKREGKSGREDRQIRVLEDDRRAARAKHVHHRTRRQARIRRHRQEVAWRSNGSLAIMGF